MIRFLFAYRPGTFFRVKTFNYNWKQKKKILKVFDTRDVYLFSKVWTPHWDYNIQSNIYYVSMGSGILRFGRTASQSNTFVTLAYKLLKEKRMKKQGSKHRFIISLVKISLVNISVLLKTAGNSSNVSQCIELSLNIKRNIFNSPFSVCFLACWTWCYCCLYLKFLCMSTFFCFCLLIILILSTCMYMARNYFSFFMFIHLFIEINCVYYIDILFVCV